MRYFLNRFKEPSSWAGIAMLATMLGAPANATQVVVQAVAAVAGAAAFFMPEKAGQ